MTLYLGNKEELPPGDSRAPKATERQPVTMSRGTALLDFVSEDRRDDLAFPVASRGPFRKGSLRHLEAPSFRVSRAHDRFEVRD